MIRRPASKFKAEPIVIDGIRFSSKAEARRYIQLSALAKNGEITDLELQPRFLLQEKFECRGKKHRAIEYVADFRYRTSTGVVVEDVKGMKTDVYKLKLKLLLHRHRDQFIFCEYKGSKQTFF